jgi:hypothetical protein
LTLLLDEWIWGSCSKQDWGRQVGCPDNSDLPVKNLRGPFMQAERKMIEKKGQTHKDFPEPFQGLKRRYPDTPVLPSGEK